MTHAALLACALACAAALLLRDRLGAATARVRVRGEPALERALAAHLDATLLPGGDARGLASVPVPAREGTEPYGSAADLVRWLEDAPADTWAAAERRVEGLYRLQAALGLPAGAVAPALDAAEACLRGVGLCGREPGRIERVRPGDLVDTRRMRPANAGTRVAVPLGFVVRDAEGGMLSRARVWCR